MHACNSCQILLQMCIFMYMYVIYAMNSTNNYLYHMYIYYKITTNKLQEKTNFHP